MSESKNDNKKTLEEIHRLFTGLEKDSSDGHFDGQLLEELIHLIAKLEHDPDPILQKLSKYKNSLNPLMSVRHLATVAVPFERFLKKNIADDDFLVSSTDRDHLVVARAPLFLILDNIRSAFNVGSIFRTADTMGVQKVFLTGYTATPHQVQVERAALGSTLIMDWQQCSFLEAITACKKNHCHIVALETSAKAVDISRDFDISKPTAFILGNERFGLDTDQLAAADEIRRIPSFGIKNSLNVAVALAIATYEWRKQYSENEHHV